MNVENRVPALAPVEPGEGSLPSSPELDSPSYSEDLDICPSGDHVLDQETRNLLRVFLRDHTGLATSRWNRTQSQGLSTMKRVVVSLIEKHRLAYNSSVSKLSLDERGDDMSFFTLLASQVISNEINWGRIVSLVAFGAVVCQHQVNNGRAHCVDLVGQEISSYLLSDQRGWLVENNAWEGFVEFFHVPDPEAEVKNTLMVFAGLAGIIMLALLLSELWT